MGRLDVAAVSSLTPRLYSQRGQKMATRPPPTDDQVNNAKLQVLLSFLNRQVEAGKWLLASLLVINGGAIAGLLSTDKIPPEALAASGRHFITGVGLAFAAGVMSWAVADGYIYLLRADLEVNIMAGEVPDPSHGQRLVTFAGVLAFACTIGSLAFFGLGALSVTDAMVAKAQTTIDAKESPAKHTG